MPLDPDPFQHHPAGPWEERHRPLAVAAIEDALDRHAAGLASREELGQDKNPRGIKYWLWYMQHPPHEVWKKIGRPYWSVDAYRAWKAQFLKTPPDRRYARDGGPALATIPRRGAGEDWLIHEHVVPQKVLRELLLSRSRPVSEILALNIGAVITRREDRRLPTRSSHPEPTDPWRRYAGAGIRFVPNPQWTPEQVAALERHDLIARKVERP
jgi:hypothetical protein